jgi:hypothetical protein
MRRILLSCTLLAVLTLPSATATVASAAVKVKPGYVVVRKATGDGGVSGRPVVTLIVRGFVLGRVSQEGKVDVVQLPTVNGQGAPQATPGVSTRAIHWGPNKLPGKEFSGSNFRFRALDGRYRVVVRGSGIYLFAGGIGQVTFRGSSVYKRHDGTYSVDAGTPRSLPGTPLTRKFGRG